MAMKSEPPSKVLSRTNTSRMAPTRNPGLLPAVRSRQSNRLRHNRPKHNHRPFHPSSRKRTGLPGKPPRREPSGAAPPRTRSQARVVRGQSEASTPLLSQRVPLMRLPPPRLSPLSLRSLPSLPPLSPPCRSLRPSLLPKGRPQIRLHHKSHRTGSSPRLSHRTRQPCSLHQLRSRTFSNRFLRGRSPNIPCSLRPRCCRPPRPARLLPCCLEALYLPRRRGTWLSSWSTRGSTTS